MPELAEMDLYCLEARALIAQAENTVHRLGENGACEGHRLMATQGLTAMRHLSRVIELHRNRLAFEALPNAVTPPVAPRRTWLATLRQRLAVGGPVLEPRA